MKKEVERDKEIWQVQLLEKGKDDGDEQEMGLEESVVELYPENWI